MAGLAIQQTYEGSVYRVRRVNDSVVHLCDKGMVSAYDKERYEHISGLAEIRTAQTVLAMGFLRRQGWPVAFLSQVNDTTIACTYDEMAKQEWVTRSLALGSYLKRNPKAQEGERFAMPLAELFAKQALDLRDRANPQLVDGNSIGKGPGIYHDPYIMPEDKEWLLYAADTPVRRDNVLHRITPMLQPAVRAEMRAVMLKAYGAFKQAVESIDCSGIGDFKRVELADWKVEFSQPDAKGKFRLADVVNLDCMRLLKDGDTKRHLSKQVFRLGGSHEEVLEVYRQGLEVFKRLPT